MLGLNIPPTRYICDDAVKLAKAAPIEDELARRGIRLRRQGRELVGPCPSMRWHGSIRRQRP